MVLKRLVAVMFLFLPIAVQAQSVDDAVEQWLIDDGNEEAVAEMADALNQLREEPVNINDTNALADLPLLSPTLGHMLGSGERSTEETMTIVNSLVLSFFNCYLKGEGVFTAQEIY